MLCGSLFQTLKWRWGKHQMLNRGHTACHNSSLTCWVSKTQLKPLVDPYGFSGHPPSVLGGGREERTRNCTVTLSCPIYLISLAVEYSRIRRWCTKVGGKSNLKILACLTGNKTAPKSSIAVIRISKGFLYLKIRLGEWSELQISSPLSYEWNSETMR